MLKSPLYCTSSCELRDVCLSQGASSKTKALAGAIRSYCRHTRWFAIAGVVVPLMAIGLAGIKLFAI